MTSVDHNNNKLIAPTGCTQDDRLQTSPTTLAYAYNKGIVPDGDGCTRQYLLDAAVRWLHCGISGSSPPFELSNDSSVTFTEMQNALPPYRWGIVGIWANGPTAPRHDEAIILQDYITGRFSRPPRGLGFSRDDGTVGQLEFTFNIKDIRSTHQSVNMTENAYYLNFNHAEAASKDKGETWHIQALSWYSDDSSPAESTPAHEQGEEQNGLRIDLCSVGPGSKYGIIKDNSGEDQTDSLFLAAEPISLGKHLGHLSRGKRSTAMEVILDLEMVPVLKVPAQWQERCRQLASTSDGDLVTTREKTCLD